MTQLIHSFDDDQEWRAFRYVSGDLADDELTQFETELETSQSAREAVARAVELGNLVALAETRNGSSEILVTKWDAARPFWTRRVLWLGGVAIAASVAGLVWIGLGNSWRQPGFEANSQVAEIWSESITTTTDSALANTVNDEPAPVADELATDELSVDDVPPSWLTAGVVGLSGEELIGDADGDGKPDESWDDERGEN